MKARELREMSSDELERKLEELRTQLFKLRFQRSTGQLDNPVKIRLVRKDIARVLTVMNERKAERSGR